MGTKEIFSTVAEAAEHLNAIIEYSFDGIFITDKNCNVLRINHSYEEITGLTKDEILGKNMADLVQQKLISESGSLIVSRTKRPVTLQQRFKSGKEALVTSSPIFDKNGELLMIVTNVRDLTEIYNLKESIQEKTDAIERLRLELEHIQTPLTERELIVRDETALAAMVLANRVAPMDTTVILFGETGVGKEVMARYIYQHSSRAKNSFIQVNCGAIPPSLIESELFGYESGAFTGASRGGKIGLFELADKGTLFLDEIGDLELSCQVKLLRVLQDQTFEVLGDSRPRKVDIRVVSATNRNLREMVVERMFREDLFYRINLITVHLPALRERKDDIPLLVRYFADKQSEINGLPTVRFSSEALTFLQKLPYPGNIRELKNLVERTILVSGKAVLEASDFESQCFHTMLSAKAEAASSLEGLTLDELEKQTILQALKTHAGNLSHVATALGISRAALYRRLEKYDIPVDK